MLERIEHRLAGQSSAEQFGKGTRRHCQVAMYARQRDAQQYRHRRHGRRHGRGQIACSPRKTPACMFVTIFVACSTCRAGCCATATRGTTRPICCSAPGRAANTAGGTGIPFGIDPTNAAFVSMKPCSVPATRCSSTATGSRGLSIPKARTFGTGRLEAAVETGRGGSAAELVAGVSRRNRGFREGADQSDDITALALVLEP